MTNPDPDSKLTIRYRVKVRRKRPPVASQTDSNPEPRVLNDNQPVSIQSSEYPMPPSDSSDRPQISCDSSVDSHSETPSQSSLRLLEEDIDDVAAFRLYAEGNAILDESTMTSEYYSTSYYTGQYDYTYSDDSDSEFSNSTPDTLMKENSLYTIYKKSPSRHLYTEESLFPVLKYMNTPSNDRAKYKESDAVKCATGAEESDPVKCATDAEEIEAIVEESDPVKCATDAEEVEAIVEESEPVKCATDAEEIEAIVEESDAVKCATDVDDCCSDDSLYSIDMNANLASAAVLSIDDILSESEIDPDALLLSDESVVDDFISVLRNKWSGLESYRSSSSIADHCIPVGPNFTDSIKAMANELSVEDLERAVRMDGISTEVSSMDISDDEDFFSIEDDYESCCGASSGPIDAVMIARGDEADMEKNTKPSFPTIETEVNVIDSPLIDEIEVTEPSPTDFRLLDWLEDTNLDSEMQKYVVDFYKRGCNLDQVELIARMYPKDLIEQHSKYIASSDEYTDDEISNAIQQLGWKSEAKNFADTLYEKCASSWILSGLMGIKKDEIADQMDKDTEDHHN